MSVICLLVCFRTGYFVVDNFCLLVLLLFALLLLDCLVLFSDSGGLLLLPRLLVECFRLLDCVAWVFVVCLLLRSCVMVVGFEGTMS